VILLTYLGRTRRSPTGIAAATGLPLSTAHRLIHELVTWRLLERTADRGYCVRLPLRLIGAAGGVAADVRGRRPSCWPTWRTRPGPRSGLANGRWLSACLRTQARSTGATFHHQ
jgi:hypothetical protein